ncbi:MAG: 3-demethylubiquinone-9 3-O-methyltransferase, partial [Betaproteobacteria bacterium]|nr:3-demethylubiquinone-9 3-O-methyltransferase [Betaproteobacteria bacterium]
MTAQAFFDGGEWWRRDGAFRLLHDINPLRLKFTAQAAGGLAGKRLLDLGCGGGIFAEAAAAAGARVLGCDISAGAVAAAKAHAEKSGAKVEYRTGGAMLSEAGQYDVLTCFEVLEHAECPAAVVADAAAQLKPGGVAVFSTINR